MTMSGERKVRPRRVGDRIREEIEAMLLRGMLRDPALRGAFVSNVEVSPDLSVADVRVRTLDTVLDEHRKRDVVRGFVRAAALLRREVGARLGLRRAPELRFHWDDGFDHALRIEALLAEVRQEDRGREPSGGEGA
jgi:ribosome-binding factor A